MKTVTLILSRFDCDKNCPYCTAKTTRWPIGDDNLDRLGSIFNIFKEQNKYFNYFVISGNGEPTLYSNNDLNKIITFAKWSNIFKDYRLQTSGNVFFDDTKFKILSDVLFKVSRVSSDSLIDRKILNYEKDYIGTINFKKARIWVNHILLKSNINNLAKDIENYLKFPNIEGINLSILNLNTLDGSLTSKQSKWILEHSLQDTDSYFETKGISEKERLSQYEKDSRPVFLYPRKVSYGIEDTVIYRGQVTDYHLTNFEEER